MLENIRQARFPNPHKLCVMTQCSDFDDKNKVPDSTGKIGTVGDFCMEII